MFSPIHDYALLGNLRCAALVSRAGSIDWFCPGKFDAPACFSALLGNAGHGRWLIQPDTDEFTCERHYRPDTLVLETFFTTEEGTVKITDAMPLGADCHIVRLVECVAGTATLNMLCAPRLHYGKIEPLLAHDGHNRVIFKENGDQLMLTAIGTDVEIVAADAEARFALAQGEEVVFILSYAATGEPIPTPPEARQALEDCANWWLSWISHCEYTGRWETCVKRSLITLKAMTYEPSGGMVAAPTTSLPEVPGGEANYDYRFCWLRDAAFALKVLLNSGYKEEAKAWLDWLLKAVEQHEEPLHALYTIDANIAGEEKELPWLPGYLDSKPVRSGNAASRQYQLDIRGELMEVFHLARSHGIEMDGNIWQLQCEILDHMEDHWQEPETGIWEFRTIKDHLTHSKVLAWVAYDRCIRDAERFGFEAPLEKWRKHRDAIRADVLKKGINPDGRYFTQRYGAPEVDASLLMIPLVEFLPADDPRMLATIKVIERELCENGLVRRYRTGDQANIEGLFIACGFWLADNYWLAGRKKEAEALFKQLLALSNDVGLLAEECDPKTRELLGNFPQGLSHLALISTARLITTANEDDVALD